MPLPRRGRVDTRGAPRSTARGGAATHRWPLTDGIFPPRADAKVPDTPCAGELLRLLAEEGEGLLGQRDVLRVEILVDSLEPALAAEPGLLDAAERRGRVGDDAAVDANHAGFDALG